IRSMEAPPASVPAHRDPVGVDVVVVVPAQKCSGVRRGATTVRPALHGVVDLAELGRGVATGPRAHAVAGDDGPAQCSGEGALTSSDVKDLRLGAEDDPRELPGAGEALQYGGGHRPGPVLPPRGWGRQPG